MDAQEELLQRFGRMIELPAFLAQRGFELSRDAAPGEISMTRDTTGEKVRLEKDLERGGWIYVSASDPKDRGSVVDFVTRHDGATPKACLERLISCCDDRSRGSQEATRYRAVLRAMPPALEHATRQHEEAKRNELAANMTLDRMGVSRGTLDEWRFGAVKQAADVSALINEPKALWASKYRAGDKAVVLVERPIDAIAYERAHGRQSVCYLATGSRPDEEQRRRVAHLLAEVPSGTRVVLAYGRDDEGRRLAAEVQKLAPMARVDRHAPEFGARWSDQMQLERRHAISMKKVSPALGR